MKPFAIALALVLVAVLAFQRLTLSRLSAENAQLGATHRAAEQLSANLMVAGSEADVSGEIANLQTQNHELLKLRNEVQMLREQTGDLNQLRTENERLRALAQRADSQMPPLPPFLANLPILNKEGLTNAGFATPEAAAQTYFWAIREANLEAWITCLSPKLAESVKERGANDLFLGLIKQNATKTGYVFGGRQAEGKGRVRLMVWGILDLSYGTTSSTSGQIRQGRTGFQLQLQKIGAEWKLEQ